MPNPVDSPSSTDLSAAATAGGRKPWRTPIIDDAKVGGVTNAKDSGDEGTAGPFFKAGS